MDLIRKSFERYASKIKRKEIKEKLYPHYRLMWIFLSCFLGCVFAFLALVAIYTGLYGDEAQETEVFQTVLFVMLSLSAIFALMLIAVSILLNYEMKKALQYERSLKEAGGVAALSEDVGAASDNGSPREEFGEIEEDEESVGELNLLFPDPDLRRQVKESKKKQLLMVTIAEIALIFLLLILAVAFREYFEKGEWQGYVIFTMVAYLDICQMAHIALERFSLSGLMKRQRTLIADDGRYELTKKAHVCREALRPYVAVFYVCSIAALPISFVLALCYPADIWSAFGLLPVVIGIAVMRFGGRKCRKEIEGLIRIGRSQNETEGN